MMVMLVLTGTGMNGSIILRIDLADIVRRWP